MIDIKLIREQLDTVRENISRRNDPAALQLLEEFIEIDSQWRKLKGRADELRGKRNKISQQINEARKHGQPLEGLLQHAKEIPQQLETVENELKALEHQHHSLHLRIPNLLDESVPEGKDAADNKEIRRWGTPKKPDFELRPHGEIVEMHGGNFARSAKIAGNGFYFLAGDLALLNQAVIQFAIHFMSRKGYVYTEPPLMMRQEAYEGVIDLAGFEDMLYKIEGEDLHMIATAEHPLTAQFMNEEIHKDKLPLKLCGYSMCFRKEIGSAGVDAKGLFRTHQFNKVEQIILCRPEDSKRYHEELLQNNEELFQALDIPHRVIVLCSGDTGKVSSKTYDTETWMPRQQEYKEVGSASNCTDYQARRLNIRFQDKDGQYKPVHTLNATTVATGRALVAILENNQQKDGSILVPKALIPFMGGKTMLTPVKQ